MSTKKLDSKGLMETVRDTIYEVLEEEIERRLQEAKTKKKASKTTTESKKAAMAVKRIKEQKDAIRKKYRRLNLLEKKWMQKATDPEHEGDFTKKAEAAGMSVQQYAKHVLKKAREGSWKGDEDTVNQAKFAKAAKSVANENAMPDLEEKWDKDVKVKHTGEFSDRTIASLKKELNGLKKKEDKTEADKKREHQLMFAIRAKRGWSK